MHKWKTWATLLGQFLFWKTAISVKYFYRARERVQQLSTLNTGFASTRGLGWIHSEHLKRCPDHHQDQFDPKIKMEWIRQLFPMKTLLWVHTTLWKLQCSLKPLHFLATFLMRTDHNSFHRENEARSAAQGTSLASRRPKGQSPALLSSDPGSLVL